MNKKSCSKALAALLAMFIVGAFAIGCSRDPNVRKQKYFASGKRYMDKGKYREAAIEFSNALRIDSKFADAHYQLALCDLKLNAVQNGYIELSRTVALNPDNLKAEIDLGNLLLVGGQYEKAMERADFVLSKDANSVSAHILKADASAGLHQMDQALSEMNAAVGLDPKRADSYVNLGVLETAQTPDSPQAEASFRKAIELDAKGIQPRLALAAFYDHSKRFNEAEQQLQEAIKIAPKDLRARSALVRHYVIQGQKEAAEKAAKDTKAAFGSDPSGVEFLAKFYLAAHDLKAATDEYRQLTQQFPKERQIQNAYLDLLMLQGQNEAAAKQADVVLKRFSKDNHALTAKGLLLMSQSKSAEARDVLQSVVKADPQNVIAHYILGNSFKALGDMGQAEAQWHEAARIKPEYLPAQQALAALALSKKDFASLTQIAKILQERAPNAAEGYEDQAVVDAANNDAKSAEAHLERAISLNPRSAMPYVQLGQLRMALHRDAEAQKNLEDALRIDPQQTTALRVLAQIYINRRQPEKAVSLAQKMVTEYPNNGSAHLILGELAAAQKNYEVAENEFSKAAELMPIDASAYSALASVQLNRNEVAKARVTYETAIQKSPNIPNPYMLLGALYERENDTEDAEKYYRKALEIRPDFAPAANNLAYLLVQNGGNLDEAISYAQAARRQLPESGPIADTLGWAYYQKGNSSLAIQSLQDAVSAVPGSSTYHYHLGLAYSKSGDRSRARAELQKAIQLEIDSSKKDDFRKKLAEVG